MSTRTKFILVVAYMSFFFTLGYVFGITSNKTEGQITSEAAVTARVAPKALEYPLNEEVMTIEWVSDPVKVRAVLDQHMEDAPREAGFPVGLSLKVNDKCIIYAFEPEYDRDSKMTILGHEALHCFRGSFD